MSYTPPSSDALEFSIESSYTAPSSDALDFGMGFNAKTINLDASSTSSLSHTSNAVFALSSNPISTSSLSHSANRLIPIANTLTSTSSLFGEIEGGEISTPNRIGSARLGGGQLGEFIAGLKKLTLNSSSSSTVSQSLNAIFALSQTTTSTTSLSNSINGTFTLSLKSERERIGNSRLGSDQLGQPQSFEANSNLSLDQNAIFSLSKVSQSDSSFSANIIRARVINVNSTSVSTFKFILSEDSYAEQYGREQGNAEIDTVVEGTAERDTIVEGNAELDIIVVGNANVD